MPDDFSRREFVLSATVFAALGSALPEEAEAQMTLEGVLHNPHSTIPGHHGTYSGTYLTGVTLGTYSAVTFTNTALIQNASGPAVLGSNPVTIINSGLISSTGGDGIDLSAGGVLTTASGGTISSLTDNAVRVAGAAGTVVNNSVIVGTGSSGVILSSGGSVTNSGTITGTGYTGVRISGAAGYVTNSGAITGGGLYQNGVGLYTGGSVYNDGTITGTYGVYVTGAYGTVTNNRGTITGNVGIELNYGGTVTNTAAGGGHAQITGSSIGIVIAGAIGTVANVGTHSTIAGVTSYGVQLPTGSTIENTGTIIGVPTPYNYTSLDDLKGGGGDLKKGP